MRTVTGRTDRIVIVGAGLGGLACALHLVAAGREVTVLERDLIPGGRAGRISVAGYEFDTGPTVLTAPDVVAETLGAVGENLDDWLDLVPLDPAMRAHFPDGTTLDLYADEERMADEVAQVCGTREAAGYRLFSRQVRDQWQRQRRHLLGRNVDGPLSLARPGLARLAAGRLDTRRFLRDPRTRQAFAYPTFFAGTAFANARAGGAWYPRGGLNALAQALAGAAEKHGVTIRYGTTARRVETYVGRAHAVHTTEGERIAADAVVLNPDQIVAYRDLLPSAPGPRRLDRLRHAPSCVVLHLGSPQYYSRAAHQNVHFGRAWAESLADVRRHGRCMRDPIIQVTNPTRTDPTLAPTGRHVYQVLVPVPNLQGNGPTAGEWRNGLGHRYAGELVATLEARGYLDLGAGLDVSHVVTPADWAEAGYTAGTPFGPAHVPAQSGPLRPGNLHPRLSNVVFTGSGTRPGVGVPLVLLSGRLASQRITGGRA